LASLFDLASDTAYFAKDAQGRYVLVNESLLLRHGLERKEDAIGKRPCDICAGDFGRIPTEQDEWVLRTGRPLICHLELQWQRPHEPVWCLTSKLPIRDASGAVTGLIGFSQDVRTPLDSNEIPPAFAAAIGEHEQDPSAPMTPLLLARKSGMSRQRLARLIKRVFGLTPSQLITKTRLTAASRLLRETKRTVADIALACGYSDQSAFTRAFRAATGRTPLEHRRPGAANRV
jgi:AraC-like DNA-binding protein